MSRFVNLKGSIDQWGFMLSTPLFPAMIGYISFIFFLPDTPRALIDKDKDETRAREGKKIEILIFHITIFKIILKLRIHCN